MYLHMYTQNHIIWHIYNSYTNSNCHKWQRHNNRAFSDIRCSEWTNRKCYSFILFFLGMNEWSFNCNSRARIGELHVYQNQCSKMHWSLLYLLGFNLKSVGVGSFIYSHFIISKRKKIYRISKNWWKYRILKKILFFDWTSTWCVYIFWLAVEQEATYSTWYWITANNHASSWIRMDVNSAISMHNCPLI